MAILNFINILGFIILIHAAYSAAHCRDIPTPRVSTYAFTHVHGPFCSDKGLASEFNATMEGPPLDVRIELAFTGLLDLSRSDLPLNGR